MIRSGPMHITDRLESVSSLALPPEHSVTDVCVVAHGDQYRMWLSTSDGEDLLSAASDSPTQWRAEDFRPLRDSAHLASGARQANPFVLHHQKLWYLWCTTPPSADGAGSTIQACTSSHGERWLGHALALEAAALGAVALADAAVVRDHARHVWLMACSAHDGAQWHICLAESHNLQDWAAIGVIVESWLPSVHHCRHPRLMRIGSAWHLFIVAEEDEGRLRACHTVSTDLVWWPTPLPLFGGPGSRANAQHTCVHPLRVGDDLLLYCIDQREDRAHLHIEQAGGVFS